MPVTREKEIHVEKGGGKVKVRVDLEGEELNYAAIPK